MKPKYKSAKLFFSLPQVPVFSQELFSCNGFYSYKTELPKSHNKAFIYLHGRLKQLFEFCLTICIILFFSPFFVLLPLWIKCLDPRGPIFYWQKRIGYEGKAVSILKFRTMYMQAPEKLQELLNSCADLQQQWDHYGKLCNDPRILPKMHWIRKFSLDELPQLFQVLTGKIKLIGPRAFEYEHYKFLSLDPHKAVKLKLITQLCQPGLTGLWQVQGRNRLTIDERLNLDIHYCLTACIQNDLKIALKTVFAMLNSDGAY